MYTAVFASATLYHTLVFTYRDIPFIPVYRATLCLPWRRGLSVQGPNVLLPNRAVRIEYFILQYCVEYLIEYFTDTGIGWSKQTNTWFLI